MRRKLNHSWKAARWIVLDRNETVHALVLGCSGGMARIIARAFLPDLMYELKIIPERLASDSQFQAALNTAVLTREVLETLAIPKKEERVTPEPPAPKFRPKITSGRMKVWTGPIGKLSAGGEL